MDDLALLAAQSAAKAVGGLAVRASSLTLKSALLALRPAPAAVRRTTGWTETKKVRAATKVIESYLGGRVCRGLLEILAVLEAAPDGQDGAAEKAELAATFRRELARKLDLDDAQAGGIADALWSDLGDCVRLHIAELRAADVFDVSDLAYVTSLVGTFGQSGSSPMARVVAERAGASVDNVRARMVQEAVRAIARAQYQRYAKLVMPHSREDYLVPVEELYVPRVLHSIADAADIAEANVSARRFLVIGNPGAGKSTFIRHLLYRTAADTDDQRAPLVVELKDHQVPQGEFVAALADRLQVTAQLPVSAQTVTDILLLGLAVVVFDGLDEIADVDHRRDTAAAIEAFALRYPLVRVVVTAREEGFVTARLDAEMFPVHRLFDFDAEQVDVYVRKWFRIAGRGTGEADLSVLAQRFLDDSTHVLDLRTNPLMLSLLCLIYRYEGYIPENRPEVYEECAHLLFERWDQVRRVPIPVNRALSVRYLVQELGYYFFNREARLGGETESKLRQIVADYFERNVVGGVESARTQAQDFLDYCAGRAWLLTQVTTERGERVFGFTHRTFMEYYAARYIVRQCSSASALVAMIKPMILLGTSEVVPQIALQQFDDKNDRGADDCFLKLLFDADVSADRRTLLKFTLRTLRYMRPSANMVRRIFEATLVDLGRTLDVEVAVLLLSAPADLHDLLVLVCARRRPELDIPDGSDGYGPSGADPVRERVEAEHRYRRQGAIMVTALLGNRKPGESSAGVAQRLLRSDTTLIECLGARLDLLRRAEPEVISAFTDHGLLTLDQFLKLLSVRQLVETGLLATRLADFFVRETEHLDLRPILAAVYGDVRAMQGLTLREAADLLEAAEQSAIGADALIAEFGRFVPRLINKHFPVRGTAPAADSLGLRVVYLAVLCAAYDYEMDGALWPSNRTWRDLATALPDLAERFRASSIDIRIRFDRPVLSDIVLAHVRAGRYDQHWVDLFVEWAGGRRVFSRTRQVP